MSSLVQWNVVVLRPVRGGLQSNSILEDMTELVEVLRGQKSRLLVLTGDLHVDTHLPGGQEEDLKLSSGGAAVAPSR